MWTGDRERKATDLSIKKTTAESPERAPIVSGDSALS